MRYNAETMNATNNTVYQINQTDLQGGAARIAWLLHKAYHSYGVNSKLIVKQKFSSDNNVIEIPKFQYRSQIQRLVMQSTTEEADKSFFKYLAHPVFYASQLLGLEAFGYPSTKHIPYLGTPSAHIIHAHNLHVNYFDLRQIQNLSHKFPFLITLHDTWLITGHCGYFIDCQKWKSGCGKCPDLNRYPAIRRDATSCNWKKKKKIYQNSKLFIASPSQWLLDQISDSMLSVAILEKRLIHNGVDQTVFKPSSSKIASRLALNLPQNDVILLFVTANNASVNPYKDYTTIKNSVRALRYLENSKPITLVCLSEAAGIDKISENITIRYFPYVKSSKEMAVFYQTADLYLHAATADNYPNTIIEASSCGLPVIATNVGGISEQILHAETGYLVQRGDSREMAVQIHMLINDQEQLKKLSENSIRFARPYYSHHRMAREYLDYYSDTYNQWKSQ